MISESKKRKAAKKTKPINKKSNDQKNLEVDDVVELGQLFGFDLSESQARYHIDRMAKRYSE